MRATIDYLSNKASVEQLAEHLTNCGSDFVPPLHERVRITDYANKISSKAMRFEAWSGNVLVGLVAAYFNEMDERIAYITSVSVLLDWTGVGIAGQLMNQCIEHAKATSMRRLSLEVATDNTQAIRLYETKGFVARAARVPFVCMTLDLSSG